MNGRSSPAWTLEGLPPVMREGGVHLMLMAFLQRILNGGGILQREHGLGRGAVDLVVTWRGRMVVFDRRKELAWEDQLFLREVEHAGKGVRIVGC